MLDNRQIIRAKEKLSGVAGGAQAIGHVMGETADILTFPSSRPIEEIEAIAKELRDEFGYRCSVTRGTLPLGGDTWYQVQFT